MNAFDRIYQEIINDQENQFFTEKGWVSIYKVTQEAKILIVGPAPGIKTQEKQDVLRDKSGETLREWLGVSDDLFYQSGKFAVLPLDFYFPGKGKVGDLPPRKGFAEKWHPRLLQLMPQIELIVLMGLEAQKYYLKKEFKGTLTKTVFCYDEFLPKYFPIVHPSPLNFRWMKRNPNFVTEVVPELRKKVQAILSES